jgi:hypothetical protein
VATTTEHISARSDGDLIARTIATAEMLGVPNANNWVQQNMGLVVGIEVDAGQSMADVYAYALSVRNAAIAALPPLPGANLSAVTDTHIQTAIQSFFPPAGPTE